MFLLIFKEKQATGGGRPCRQRGQSVKNVYTVCPKSRRQSHLLRAWGILVLRKLSIFQMATFFILSFQMEVTAMPTIHMAHVTSKWVNIHSSSCCFRFFCLFVYTIVLTVDSVNINHKKLRIVSQFPLLFFAIMAYFLY